MNKKILTLSLAMMMVIGTTASAQLKIGGKSINAAKVVGAAADVTTALTLSDADVAEICREAVDWMDKNNPIADEKTEYGKRLVRLTKGMTQVNGMPLNFKVYHVIDINAFACGDGSIRVFSSLMDIMNDDELVAIIGHEIGHIAGADSKEAIKSAYLMSAAGKAAGSVNGSTVAKLSDSELGELTKSFMGAKFSQKQEYAADQYGFKICVDNGFSPYGMAEALQRLVELSNGAQATAIEQMFSSHPDSAKRSDMMRKAADKYVKTKK